MKQRILQFFILGVFPWIFMLTLTINYIVRDKFSGGRSTNLLSSVAYSYGIQAFACLTVLIFLILVIRLSERAINPVESLISQISEISSGKSLSSPTQTGLADMDEIISNLHASSIDTRRRIDSERTLAADVSHQLRSPLAALSLRIEQIADGAEGTKVQDDAQAALGQIDRLVKLVEGLLSTWRETANRELSPIDIEEFLGTNAARWQTRFSNEGRTLKVEIQPGLIALGTVDVQNLVISILLENSLQHGAGDTTISAKDYQSWVLIEVSDQGEGISDEIRSRLMSQGSTTKGNGLGLAWARSQVASDGGRLELRKFKPAVFGIFLISVSKNFTEQSPVIS